METNTKIKNNFIIYKFSIINIHLISINSFMGNQSSTPFSNKNDSTNSSIPKSHSEPNVSKNPSYRQSYTSNFSTTEFTQKLSYVNEFKCSSEYKSFVRCVLIPDPRCKDIYASYGYCTMRYMEPLVHDCFLQSNENLLENFGESRLPSGSVTMRNGKPVFDIPPEGTESRKKWCLSIGELQNIMKEWEIKSREVNEKNPYLDEYFNRIRVLDPLPKSEQIKSFPSELDGSWEEMENYPGGMLAHPCMKAAADFEECLSVKAESEDHEVKAHLACSMELMKTKVCFEKYHCSDPLLECANHFEDGLDGYRMCRDSAVRPHLKYNLGKLERCLDNVQRFLS